MNPPPYLQSQKDGVYLAVKAQPRASRNEIGEVVGAELKIKVTAPPVDSAANEALVRFLAEILDCPRGAVQVVRGQTSRHKLFRVQGLPLGTVAAKLGQSG